MVVVQGVIPIPGWVICGDPWTIQSRSDLTGPAGRGGDVLRRIIEFLKNRIANLNKRL